MEASGKTSSRAFFAQFSNEINELVSSDEITRLGEELKRKMEESFLLPSRKCIILISTVQSIYFV